MKSRSQNILVAAMLLFIFLVSAGKATASGAMPYTDDALDRLNSSALILGTPDILHGEDDQKVRNYITKYREIFASAGFDYEKSMMKIINDIQFERYRVNKATIKLNALARELLRLHVRSNVNPRKYLSKDCAELLIEFRALIRSNSVKYGSC